DESICHCWRRFSDIEVDGAVRHAYPKLVLELSSDREAPQRQIGKRYSVRRVSDRADQVRAEEELHLFNGALRGINSGLNGNVTERVSYVVGRKQYRKRWGHIVRGQEHSNPRGRREIFLAILIVGDRCDEIIAGMFRDYPVGGQRRIGRGQDEPGS